MRIRTFTAKTVSGAMADVRREIGTQAVIIQVEEATRKTPARVVVALEQMPHMDRADLVIDTLPDSDAGYSDETIKRLFAIHGVNDTLATELQNSLASFQAIDLKAALTQALDLTLRFRPFSVRVQSSAILIGQPGQGKSLAALRLAASAHAAGRSSRLITLDSESAGAMHQLESFCRALEIDIQSMTASDLAKSGLEDDDRFTIVDTTGMNPYAIADIQDMSHILASTRIEPVWVTACGADSGEFLEQARIFREFGVQRIIATRADSCRRFGALINLMGSSRMALAGLSASPFMSEPLLSGSAYTLAQKLLAAPLSTPVPFVEKIAV